VPEIVSAPTTSANQRERLALTVRGAVQGVGFRPFVHRLATALRLGGWVSNTPQGLSIEVEGNRSSLEEFLLRVEREKPPHAHIQSLEPSFLDPVGYASFEIRASRSSGPPSTVILPDLATCPECRSEIFDPSNRRYLYPFTNCTHCGPRFSIIEALPYDRPNTSMKNFTMCPECSREYHDPSDRRFHAQPNACPVCGPHTELWDADGRLRSSHHNAVLEAADLIRSGAIVALKGLGGFHLLVDARQEDAVRRLRARKRREEKPFALMFPTVDAVREACELSALEERLLLSAESPIVLLRRLRHGTTAPLPDLLAPANPCLGVMLPYTPLHHILLKELNLPLVATSGNLSDEPICTDEREALARLRGIADFFLVHDRPIVRHVDDSVVRVLLDRELVLRRARGFAPLPLPMDESDHPPALAVGAHLKNTVALTTPSAIVVSQHIGDLETLESLTAFRRVIDDLERLYRARAATVVCDLHPDYLSTHHARRMGRAVHSVQHHYAHIVSCMAENRIEREVLGVAWDGTGYGTDGTVWGGEFLLTTPHLFERMGTFQAFRLPGGDRAVVEPRRTALSLLFETLGPSVFDREDLAPVREFNPSERSILRRMLEKGINAPFTTSAGRLFDGVASLVGLRQRARFEGQAPMELEFAAESGRDGGRYPFGESEEIRNGRKIRVFDWRPIILGILDDLKEGTDVSSIARRFHETMASVILSAARAASRESVVLSGGCFQNARLLTRTVQVLSGEGFRPYWHQRVPPNDGGISLGQLAAYERWQRAERDSRTQGGAAEP
jgi:hydrogenase maturation protein HypF